MKRNYILTFIAVLLTLKGQSQYYYKDYMSNIESNTQFNSYKANKIRQIQVKSYLSDQELDETFEMTQKINGNYTATNSTSKTNNNNVNLATNKYNDKGLVTYNFDSTTDNSNTTTYTYNANNLISEIYTVSLGSYNYSATEKHVWLYNINSKPEKMFLIKNGNDTTIVHFILDAKGLVTDEVHKRKGVTVQYYYYYYNTDGLLSDIVRYNEKSQKLLPDYTFDYDAGKRVSKMIQLEAAKGESHIWQYTYDARGLKIEEAVYFKGSGRPMGKFVYIYK
jgi:hypothetical protein